MEDKIKELIKKRKEYNIKCCDILLIILKYVTADMKFEELLDNLLEHGINFNMESYYTYENLSVLLFLFETNPERTVPLDMDNLNENEEFNIKCCEILKDIFNNIHPEIRFEQLLYIIFPDGLNKNIESVDTYQHLKNYLNKIKNDKLQDGIF